METHQQVVEERKALLCHSLPLHCGPLGNVEEDQRMIAYHDNELVRCDIIAASHDFCLVGVSR
jgi:hypothetical protein